MNSIQVFDLGHGDFAYVLNDIVYDTLEEAQAAAGGSAKVIPGPRYPIGAYAGITYSRPDYQREADSDGADHE